MEHIIKRYPNGNISYEKYLINGNRHRNDGPAFIKYYENGNIKFEQYRINDKFHRIDGPAWLSYGENGNIIAYTYDINDEDVTDIAKKIIKDLDIPEDYKIWDQVQKDMFSLTLLAKVG